MSRSQRETVRGTARDPVVCQPHGIRLCIISQRAGHRSNGSLGLVRLPCRYLALILFTSVVTIAVESVIIHHSHHFPVLCFQACQSPKIQWIETTRLLIVVGCLPFLWWPRLEPWVQGSCHFSDPQEARRAPKACSRHRSAPTSNIESHLALERAQQQPLMTHIFTNGVQLTAPSHHHRQLERLFFLGILFSTSLCGCQAPEPPSPAKEMIAPRCSCRSPVGPGALMDASLTCGSDTVPVLLWPCSLMAPTAALHLPLHAALAASAHSNAGGMSAAG